MTRGLGELSGATLGARPSPAATHANNLGMQGVFAWVERKLDRDGAKECRSEVNSREVKAESWPSRAYPLV